jgi:serine/threonine protein kinase
VLQVGKQLGDFEIIRLLGKGGMGEVYEARQLNPSRIVALKVLAPWLSSNEEALERFWLEAGVPAQLDHPGIVRIISTGRTDDGTAYYTMQLVRGVSLAGLVKKSAETLASTAALLTTPPAETPDTGKNGIHSPAAALECPVGEPPPGVLEAYRCDRYGFVARIGAKAARALADAHHRGFLHRDIKPSNLMIDHHDMLYLVDFGLTKALDPGAGTSQLGVVRGTPWYMSPEQARGEAVDQRSDIYSLGVTLYELATEGKGPFTANRENTSAVMAQVKAGLRCPLRDLAPDIPHRLEKIILKAIHFKARRRYENVEELAAALEGYAGTSPSASARSAPTAALPRKRPWAWAVGALAILLGLAVAAAIYFRPDNEKREPEKNLVSQPEAASTPTYPERFKQRRIDEEKNLITKGHEPVWAATLEGEGGCQADKVREAMQLWSPPTKTRTVIALAEEPTRWFDYSVELAQLLNPKELPAGIFFGWRPATRSDADRPPFFVIDLNEKEVRGQTLHYPHGYAALGTSLNTPRRGVMLGQIEYLRPLAPIRSGHFPLTTSSPGELVWHKLTVHARGESFTIRVDELAPKTYTFSDIKNADPTLGDLDTRGFLGIWCRGTGLYRKATLTALEPKP